MQVFREFLRSEKILAHFYPEANYMSAFTNLLHYKLALALYRGGGWKWKLVALVLETNSGGRNEINLSLPLTLFQVLFDEAPYSTTHPMIRAYQT